MCWFRVSDCVRVSRMLSCSRIITIRIFWTVSLVISGWGLGRIFRECFYRRRWRRCNCRSVVDVIFTPTWCWSFDGSRLWTRFALTAESVLSLTVRARVVFWNKVLLRLRRRAQWKVHIATLTRDPERWRIGFAVTRRHFWGSLFIGPANNYSLLISKIVEIGFGLPTKMPYTSGGKGLGGNGGLLEDVVPTNILSLAETETNKSSNFKKFYTDQKTIQKIVLPETNAQLSEGENKTIYVEQEPLRYTHVQKSLKASNPLVQGRVEDFLEGGGGWFSKLSKILSTFFRSTNVIFRALPEHLYRPYFDKKKTILKNQVKNSVFAHFLENFDQKCVFLALAPPQNWCIGAILDVDQKWILWNNTKGDPLVGVSEGVESLRRGRPPINPPPPPPYSG